MNHHTRPSRLLAGLSVVALVAIAACGDDDDSTATAPAGTEAVKTSEPTATTAGSTAPASSGPSSSPTTSGSTETTTAASTVPKAKGEHSVGDEGEPVQGGTLVYGLEADTANAWAPYRASYATSGYIPLEAISDSLFTVTDSGETVPLLLTSAEHNADYTEWTLTVRDGIKFHDGTPLDGAAVAFNIKTCAYAPLTAGAYSLAGDVTASGQTVTVKPVGGPWVALPAYFSTGSCGYMMSPKWLASLPDVPQRNEKSPAFDAAVAATPADGDPAKPVGLGAFTFDSYTPGNGNAFKAVRNPDYWRGPKGITGEDLPYLDEIDAVVAVDIDSRASSVRSGDFDVMMTANADSISQFLGDNAFEVNSSQRYGDTSYFMLNVAQGADIDPKSANTASPLLNLDCRKALAYAIDRERIAKERGAGLVSAADGPFPPGSLGYLKDSGYPSFDTAKAQASMDTCLQALGTDHIEFNFNTTNDPFNVETNQLVASMWTDVFGNKVQAKITPIEQGQYIGLALTGAFQAESWRSHSGLDPDQQRLWWQSSSVSPIGALALNFGRFKDADMDAALNTIKTNPDPAARKAAAEQVNKIFGQQVYNWWTVWTLWGIISQPYVNGVQRNVLPDGSKGIGLAFAGRHQVNQMWCDNGKCE